MVNALDSGSSGLCSSPGQGHCVVFLGETLNSHSASLHFCTKESRNTANHLVLQKPEISAGLMDHLARMQT